MPARFVAGHFLRSDGMVNQQAGHAWAEAFVPDLGWVGFDPANGICTTDAHARVAIGLDYLGAAPVRGTRYGGGTETLTVAVKVDQAGRPGQWQSQSSVARSQRLVMPRECGASSTPAGSQISNEQQCLLDHPHARVMTMGVAGPPRPA